MCHHVGVNSSEESRIVALPLLAALIETLFVRGYLYVRACVRVLQRRAQQHWASNCEGKKKGKDIRKRKMENSKELSLSTPVPPKANNQGTQQSQPLSEPTKSHTLCVP